MIFSCVFVSTGNIDGFDFERIYGCVILEKGQKQVSSAKAFHETMKCPIFTGERYHLNICCHRID